MWTYSDIAKMIDHALLKPTLTTPELTAGCQMARAYDVASVCILPYAVKQCADLLSGSTVAPSTTIGFPHGASAISSKVDQSTTALADGCIELDIEGVTMKLGLWWLDAAQRGAVQRLPIVNQKPVFE